MKPVLYIICFLIPLSVLFVTIDRKNFYTGDNAAVREEKAMGNPDAEERSAAMTPMGGTKPDSGNGSEVAYANKNNDSVKETNKQTEEIARNETKAVTEIKPMQMNGMPVPDIMPIATPEEAESLNAEAVAEYKLFKKRQERLNSGFILAFLDNFNDFINVSTSKENEDYLIQKNYNLDEFRKQQFPKLWSIDYSNIPSDVTFQRADEGCVIMSNREALRITGQRFNGMASSFVLEASVENCGDMECEVSLGVNNSGFIKNGNTILVSDMIPGKGKRTLEAEINVFDRFANVAPIFEIRGSIILKEFKIYRKDFDNFTIVEGEITERSELPDPRKSDYPNCRYTAHFVGNAILSGMPCNKELCLSIDGFENQKVLKTNSIKAGDKVRCAIVPTDSIPDELASIQEADDLSLFALDSYLVTTLQKISSFTDVFTANENNAIVYFKSDVFDFKSVFERINEPVSGELKDAQKKRIAKDLAEAEEMIRYLEKNREDIEQRFQKAWAAERSKDEKGYNRVGSLVWRNINKSFWGLDYNYTLIPEAPHTLPKDKLDAIVALKDFLESNGIQLIVSLVPDRFEIASRVINSEFADVPVYQLASYVKQLSEAGVECPYNAKRIIDNYDLYPFAYLYPEDYHPGSTVQQCISEVVAKRLSDYQFPKTLDKSLFSHVQVATFNDDYNGIAVHKYPANCDIGDNTPNEFYTSDEIRYEGKRVVRNKSSEILVIGNSFAYSPGASNKQHSFPAYLAETMLHPIDDYLVLAHGPMTVIIQRFFEKPESFLLNKKVLVMHLGETHLQADNIVWNNIAEMDHRKLMLNGKQLVSSLLIPGSGNWTNAIRNQSLKTAWSAFPGKAEYMCLDETPIELVDQTIDVIDISKPFVCVVQTVRSPIYASPLLKCNGIEAVIPASHSNELLFWQDVYFQVPAGTKRLKLELQGKENTLVGFNKILIYQ